VLEDDLPSVKHKRATLEESLVCLGRDPEFPAGKRACEVRGGASDNAFGEGQRSLWPEEGGNDALVHAKCRVRLILWVGEQARRREACVLTEFSATGRRADTDGNELDTSSIKNWLHLAVEGDSQFLTERSAIRAEQNENSLLILVPQGCHSHQFFICRPENLNPL